MSKGFLGTAAPRAADLTLVAELSMGLALIMGAMLARRRWYRAHGWCQSVVVLLNLVVIAAYMVPSFRRQVAPAIPADLGDWAYTLAVAHGSAGLIAELLALYILLVAGANILPQSLRFTRYRLWMRTTLALWWLVLVLGLATYFRWYVLL
jgi:uncharacterized membrane protein YozB (DUF420 family)